jgi:hypothetical protein
VRIPEGGTMRECRPTWTGRPRDHVWQVSGFDWIGLGTWDDLVFIRCRRCGYSFSASIHKTRRE